MNVKIFPGYYRKGPIWRGYCIGIPVDADGRVVDDREFVVASFWAMTRKGIKNKMRKHVIALKGELK